MNRRTRIAPRTCAVLLVGALLAVAACGDEDAEPLTKAEFVQQADAICQETADVAEPYWTEFWSYLEGAAAESAPGDAWFPRFEELLADVVPLDRAQIEQLRDLEPPADDRAVLDTLLDEYAAGLDTLEQVAADATAGDEAARERMGSDDDPLAEVALQAQEYGLGVCGSRG